MRLLFILFLSLILVQCSKEELVYWCGDHQCKNEKERIAYFEKNMVIEMKKLSEISEDKKKESKTKAKLEKKKKIKKQKELKKQAKINEKLTLDKSKDKDIVKKKLFESNVDYENRIESIEKRAVVKKRSIKIESFDQISNIIIKENNKKSFPNINRVPE